MRCLKVARMEYRLYFSIVRRTLLAVLLCAAGCAAHHGGSDPPPLLVVGITTAHHGACRPGSRQIFGSRAARLFSQPIPYRAYKCMSRTEADLLRTGCGGHQFGKNIVFVTLGHARSVQFVQDGIVSDAHVRTFGEAWDDKRHRATMFFAVLAFPHAPPPLGVRRFIHRGPPLYGEFSIADDPLGIAGGECPTAT